MVTVRSSVSKEEVDETFSERGDAAVIAFVDSSIDIYHSSFLNDSRETRFAAIWDRDANTREDEEWRHSTNNTYRVKVGRIFTRTEINEEINNVISGQERRILRQCSRQTTQHGTAVASIATSSFVQYEDGLELTGIAPESDILFVGTSRQENEGELKYIEILDFIQNFAEEEKKPVVVNFSFGYSLGMHDGTSPLEVKCDEYSANGLIIVNSAGNERMRKSHIKRRVENGFIEWDISSEFVGSQCSVLLVFSQFSILQF
jgi:minor extracellular serine protease Vpr